MKRNVELIEDEIIHIHNVSLDDCIKTLKKFKKMYDKEYKDLYLSIYPSDGYSEGNYDDAQYHALGLYGTPIKSNKGE